MLMTTATTLLLITKDPSHPLAHFAQRYARAWLIHHSNHNQGQNNQHDTVEMDQPVLALFFYADAAHVANRLRWQSAEQVNLTEKWQTLATEYNLTLPVCVSTALSRGISDTDNSVRHQLDSENLAKGFTLVGLSELAMLMQDNCRLIQF